MSTGPSATLPLHPQQGAEPTGPAPVSNSNLGTGTQENFQQIGGSGNNQFNARTINYQGEHDSTVLALASSTALTAALQERANTPPPPSSTVPFRRDLDFVDRSELNDLEEKLSAGYAKVALVGLGGIGYDLYIAYGASRRLTM